MDFLKSVFSDDPTPPDSPTSLPPPPQDPDPAWSFGGLIKSLASNPESMIDTYRRDLEELGSGLRKETAVIREAASRVVKGLPASLEAGASVAQESLETVGKAFDDIGSTVWKSTSQIVSVGRDSILARGQDPDYESNAWNNDYSSDNRSSRMQRSLDVNRYSRFGMQLRALQCNRGTYCAEPEDTVDYEKWRIGCFVLEEKREEIETLMDQNAFIREIYNEVVPTKIDGEGFWSRYFYKVQKLKQAEEARAILVKRAMAGEEEEGLSWDFDDDGDDRDHDGKEEDKGDSSGDVELEKKSSRDSNDGMNNAAINVVQKEKTPNLSDAISESYDKLKERCEENAVVVLEGEGDNGESCKDSDVSVVSSQSLLPEEDLGWDEIDNIGSNYENKGEAVGSTRSANRVHLRKPLSAAEEEDLSWDIEDEDDEPIKP